MESDRAIREFDKGEFLSNFNGMEDVLLEVVQKFEDDLPQLTDRVRDAIQRGDSDGLHLAAHTLKGVISNFYAEPSRVLAFELETLGKSHVLSGAEVVFAKMSDELASLLKELKKLAEEIKVL